MRHRNKTMKMCCNCKGEFKTEIKDFEGLQSEALVCQKCGYVTLTMKQAGKLLKLKEIRDSFRRGRKTIRIGNTVGITLPKEFVGKEGQPVTMGAGSKITIPRQIVRALKLKTGDLFKVTTCVSAT